MDAKQQIYAMMELRRRNAMRAYAARVAMARSMIPAIAKIIVAGGDPGSDPAVKEDFWYLVGEYGEGVFNDEVNRLMMTKEEEDLPDGAEQGAE